MEVHCLLIEILYVFRPLTVIINNLLGAFFSFLQPDSVIQVRIAVCGFAFYGIMALLGNTWDLVKEFKDNNKAIVLCLIGFVWTVATIAVPLTMSARTTLDKALSQHATRLVLLGITLHMLFNVSLMLPENVWMASKINLWSLAALVFLLALAIIGHGASWIQVNFKFLDLFYCSTRGCSK